MRRIAAARDGGRTALRAERRNPDQQLRHGAGRGRLQESISRQVGVPTEFNPQGRTDVPTPAAND